METESVILILPFPVARQFLEVFSVLLVEIFFFYLKKIRNFHNIEINMSVKREKQIKLADKSLFTSQHIPTTIAQC